MRPVIQSKSVEQRLSEQEANGQKTNGKVIAASQMRENEGLPWTGDETETNTDTHNQKQEDMVSGYGEKQKMKKQ